MRFPFHRIAALGLALAGTSALAGQIAIIATGPDGKPVAGVRIAAPEVFKSGTTAKDGTAQLPDVPSGGLEVTATAPGFRPVQQHVTVRADGNTPVSIRLEASDAIGRAIASHSEPPAEHLAQKQAYLQGVKPIAGKKPNILVVLFDDLGFGDLSSYGNQLIKTPNIDALAGKGVKLEQFYSAAPVCTPSRAGLLTGRYPTRSHASNHVFFPTGHPMAQMRRALGFANALPRDEILLPEVLAKAGYATGAFGKWHLGDQPGHRPTDFGFKDYFGILYSNDMKPVTLWRGSTVDTPGDKTDQATLTERITDEAVAFLRANASKPFFAYVSYTAPHLPHVPNPKNTGVSAGGTYGDVVEDLDTNVGRLLQTLRELKVDENTIVIVTSDNGGDWGGSAGDLRGRKGETFEGGQRVPAFIIWPGVTKPGTVSREMAMNIDLLPSVLAALQIDLPQDRIVDGADIRQLLAGGATPHDYLYYITTWSGRFAGIRDRTYKFRDIVPNDSPVGAGGEPYNAVPSLYLLDRDTEAHDVSARHPDDAMRLRNQLEAFRAENARNPRGWQRATGAD